MSSYEIVAASFFGAVLGFVCSYAVIKTRMSDLMTNLETIVVSKSVGRNVKLEAVDDVDMDSLIEKYKEGSFDKIPIMSSEQVTIPSGESKMVKFNVMCTTPDTMGMMIMSPKYAIIGNQSIVPGGTTRQLKVTIINSNHERLIIQEKDANFMLMANDYCKFVVV